MTDGERAENVRNDALRARPGAVVGQSGGTRWREVEEPMEGLRCSMESPERVVIDTESWRPAGAQKRAPTVMARALRYLVLLLRAWQPGPTTS